MIKGGGLPDCSGKKEGRQQCSRSGHQQQRRSRSLPERRGGGNNEYNANKCMAMHDMKKRDARCAQRGTR